MPANCNTEHQLCQEESREPDVVGADVQTVDMDTQLGSPDHEAAPSAESEGVETEMEVDPETFKVMRGRSTQRPARERVIALVESIRQSVTIPRVIVYEEAGTGERFSPDGAHRQAAYQELRRSIPIILIVTKNAKARAERESCCANTGNARSKSDQKFQLAKARQIFQDEYGKQPKPSDLAKMTNINHTTCTAFLRGYLAPKSEEMPQAKDDKEQQDIVNKLEKEYEALRKILPEDDWLAGDRAVEALDNIANEVKRIKKHQFRGFTVTIDKLSAFMETNGLTMEQMGQLIGVKHTSISRWLKGKTKMTPHNQHVARQVLALTLEQITTMLEKSDG